MVDQVSIIIPAHNAAATLPDTLQSVLAQTFPHWEAIVIENGSTDATAAMIDEWASRDPRIRGIQSAPGVSVARNVGLSVAKHPWILFLDSDDWILPTHLERLMSRLAGDSTLDAAHCGWIRVGLDGSRLIEEFGPTDADLFPRFARTCALTIHSCITRRSLIQAAGGFDPSLRTCEDWDLWQRIARLGCRFGAVRELLACYRTRVGSASMHAAQLVSDSLKVISRGFSSDPRLPSYIGKHSAGMPADEMESTVLYTVTWAAGLAIGGGVDARPLLDLINPPPGITLDPTGVAGCIFCCAMLPAALPASAWADKFDTVDPLLVSFLQALENRINQKGLARSTHAHLARMALDIATRPRPFTVGSIHAVAIEITELIPDLTLPESIERLHCIVLVEGEKLGVMELPVIDGSMPSAVLADALAAEYAWPILGRFFSRTLYPSFRAAKDSNGWFVRRGDQSLGSGIAGNGTMSWMEAHDHIGWTVFLQEVWGAPGLSSHDFYASAPDKLSSPGGAYDSVQNVWLTIEVSDPLPEKCLIQPNTTAVLTAGGVAIAKVKLPYKTSPFSASELRSALNMESAFELCCACVREGLIGRPFSEPKSLRTRLADAAARQRTASLSIKEQVEIDLPPGSVLSLRHAGTNGEATVVIPRRFGPCGSTASRRTLLPRSLFPDIATASARNGQPLLRFSTSSDIPQQVVYLPELFWQRPAPSPASPSRPNRRTKAADTGPFGKNFFEDAFQQGRDPWHYCTPYEKTKYEQTLGELPHPRFHKALELACAEGHFTTQLATRVDDLLATDISATAVERAALRCAKHDQVRFAELDIVHDPIPGRFDLIVCSEMLYYVGTVKALHNIAAKISRALEPGGFFVTTHAHLVVDEPHRPGFDWDLPFGAKRISDVFGACPTLRLVRDLRTPLYRVQVYQQQTRLGKWLKRGAPKRTLLPQPTELPPHAAAHAHWQGGFPQRFQPAETQQTSRLPIFMYHRIEPTGTPEAARYRVTPETFESQLRALAARHYRCVSLEEWRCAMQTRKPLSGRCVVLTFDDGYRDFLEYAWPALQHYGYTATVYLPTDAIIDQKSGARPSPADDTSAHLSWDEIRQLQSDGVEFGSHSVAHPVLTSLSPTEIAREALRSRIIIEEQLNRPITSFAYPYGETDRVVEAVVGSCGYTFGLTCEERRSEFRDRLMALPRLEIRGDLDMPDFEALLDEN